MRRGLRDALPGPRRLWHGVRRPQLRRRGWRRRLRQSGDGRAVGAPLRRDARRRDVSLDERLELAGDEGLGAQAPSDAGLREVFDALDALGDPPKTQLYLSLVEGYGAREISRMCDMPVGTVYSWISRGKRRLREVLS